MTLPKQLGDREFEKFVEDADGKTAIRVEPQTIKGSSGTKLDITSAGFAQVFDRQALNQLKEITDVLNEIKFHLSLITGADD